MCLKKCVSRKIWSFTWVNLFNIRSWIAWEIGMCVKREHVSVRRGRREFKIERNIFSGKKRDFRVYLLRVHVSYHVPSYKMINGFARYLFRYKLSAENALKMENSREISQMWFYILCLYGLCASSISVEGLKFDCQKEVKSKILSIPRTTVEDVQFFMMLPWFDITAIPLCIVHSCESIRHTDLITGESGIECS